MIFSNGFIFRWGQRIKDFGERMGNARVFGVHVFGFFCRPVIGLGHKMRDSALGCPIGKM